MPDPWNRNTGKFDVPSSAVPSRGASKPNARPTDRERMSWYLARRVADRKAEGIEPRPAILERIDAAIDKLRADGLGQATCIYLDDPDLIAFAEARDSNEWRCLPVSTGAASMVYSRRGKRAVRRPRRS